MTTNGTEDNSVGQLLCTVVAVVVICNYFTFSQVPILTHFSLLDLMSIVTSTKWNLSSKLHPFIV